MTNKTHTPWGAADTVTNVAPGIDCVTTPSHGGYRLSAEMNAQVPQAWRDASFGKLGLTGWYEEDCDWCMVAMAFPEHFPEDARVAAARTFACCIAPKLPVAMVLAAPKGWDVIEA